MSCFIRKVKTKSGATAVQVVYKSGRKVMSLKHIGSAHTEEELDALMAIAEEVKLSGQMKLELFDHQESSLFLERLYSATLYESLAKVYDKLGFGVLDDEVFKQLVVARIIEPTSKLDTIRVLSNLGLDAPSNSGIHRALKRAIELDFRDTISRC